MVATDVGSGGVDLCIHAEDVVIQKGPAPQTSIRNQLPALVEAVVQEGPMARVIVNCGFPLTALVTRQSARDLNLRPGEPVTALIKATAIHLIPRS